MSDDPTKGADEHRTDPSDPRRRRLLIGASAGPMVVLLANRPAFGDSNDPNGTICTSLNPSNQDKAQFRQEYCDE